MRDTAAAAAAALQTVCQQCRPRNVHQLKFKKFLGVLCGDC